MIGKTNVGCKEKALPILTNPAAGGDIISWQTGYRFEGRNINRLYSYSWRSDNNSNKQPPECIIFW